MSKLTSWYRRLLALAELHGDREQKDIAATLGVSPGTITVWKDGKLPNVRNILAAGRAYDVDPAELFRIAYLSDDDPTGDEQPEKTVPKARGGSTTTTTTTRKRPPRLSDFQMRDPL